MRKKIFSAIVGLAMFTLSSHADDFALGADISWATEMESRGQKVYNYNGEEREATALMKEMGLSAIRLRVWVNPSEHANWCNKEDVLVKALRAKELGMDVMIDFHYSDWWADPGKQNIPAAWAKHKYKQLLMDVAEHTKEVLNLLKDNGVTPRWVQVGNETSNGMLWPVGKLDENPKQYAGLFKAGYDASKEVFPDAKVIVHLDNGYKNSLYNYNLDALRDNGAQWDIIGMSLYPYWTRKAGHDTSAMRITIECIQNIRKVVKKYGTDVMIVETGYEVNEEEPWVMSSGREQLSELIRLCKTETDGHCLGVFYWEPTCRPTHYKLGAFDMKGHPTEIMRAFTTSALNNTLNIRPEWHKNIVYDRKRLAFETTEGTIVAELYNETPQHRDNYIRLAETGALDSTLLHRVMSNFIIQGGDPYSRDAEMTLSDLPAEPLGYHSVTNENKEEYTIPAEIVYPRFFNKRGALGAARADEEKNPELRSSSSQFYFAWGKWPTARKAGSEEEPLPYYNEDQQAGVPYLDKTYTVFGEVIEGLEILQKLQNRKTDTYDRPLTDVRLNHLRVVK